MAGQLTFLVQAPASLNAVDFHLVCNLVLQHLANPMQGSLTLIILSV